MQQSSQSISSLGAVAQNNNELANKNDNNSLPIKEEGETNKLFNKNDFENVVIKLTQDLTEKIEKINQIEVGQNIELVSTENLELSQLKQEVSNQSEHSNQGNGSFEDVQSINSSNFENSNNFEIFKSLETENGIFQPDEEKMRCQTVSDDLDCDKLSEVNTVGKIQTENISSNVNASYLNIL